MKRWPLVLSFVLFIALCASIAYWGMQLFKPPLRPVAAPPRAAAEVRTEDAAALFGGRGGKTAVASNYQLRGVIFSGNGRDSVAILSADGKPAQAVRVDMEVVPGVTVQEVHREYVLLSENGVAKRVELPESAKGQANLATISPIPTRPSTPIPAPPPPPASTAPSPAPSPAPQVATPQQPVATPQPMLPEPAPTVPPNTATGMQAVPGQQAPQQPQAVAPQAPMAPPTTVVNPGIPAQQVPGAASAGVQAPVNPAAPTPTPTYPAGQPMPRAQR